MCAVCVRARACVRTYVRACVLACVCTCMRAGVCVPLASESSETIEVTIIKLGTVTASDMLMYHVLIILTSTFIQGHTDLNNENSKCLIIAETIQAMPITFAAKPIVQQKVYLYMTMRVR